MPLFHQSKIGALRHQQEPLTAQHYNVDFKSTNKFVQHAMALNTFHFGTLQHWD
jgi:hypothetical protein